MFYALVGIIVLLILAVAVIARSAFNTVTQINLLSAQEREVLTAIHTDQLSEFANRIQQPDRAAHMSISDLAPMGSPTIHPDIEEEADLIGEAR